jgi:hypothetical protein
MYLVVFASNAAIHLVPDHVSAKNNHDYADHVSP